MLEHNIEVLTWNMLCRLLFWCGLLYFTMFTLDDFGVLDILKALV